MVRTSTSSVAVLRVNFFPSYQVPKEVGKVGTESATFIEPIANRKDGIQAMFSKQKQAQQSPVKPKRKRSPSPSTVFDADVATSSRASAITKKPKLGKKPESDDEVEVLDGRSTSNINKFEAVCFVLLTQNCMSHNSLLVVHPIQRIEKLF